MKVNWRCNVVHDWVEQVPQEAYDRLGYSQDLIRQLGCSPPLVPLAPGGGAAKEADPEGRHHAPHPRPGHQAVPAHHQGQGDGGRGPAICADFARLLEGEPRGDQAAPDHGVAQG